VGDGEGRLGRKYEERKKEGRIRGTEREEGLYI
jgi:hypothetical protein